MAWAWISVSEKRSMRPSPRLRGVPGGSDQGDYGVQVVERYLEPLQDVDARLGLGQIVLRAPPDHFPPEVEKLLHQIEQRQDAAAVPPRSRAR